MRKASSRTRMLLLTAFLLCGWTAASACICGERSPCEANAGADAVFVGRVTRIIDEGAGDTNSSEQFGKFIVQFKVAEAFRGLESKEVELSAGGTSCDYTFARGQSYLVFAHRFEGGPLRTSLCSGTRLLSEAQPSLEYLRGARAERGATVQGSVERAVFDRATAEGKVEVVSGARVTVKGEGGEYRGTTAADGSFRIRNVPAGIYRISTEPTSNFVSFDRFNKTPATEWAITVPAFGCRDMVFAVFPSASISGRLTALPARGSGWVDLELVPVGVALTDKNSWTATVADNGEFRFDYVAPGRYYLGVNLRYGPSFEQAYPATYFPGVQSADQATVIEVRANQTLTGYDLALPAPVARRVVKGIARWPDGRPASGIRVTLENTISGYREGNGVETEADGRFTLEGMEGQTYNLSALIHDGVPLVNSVPIKVTLAAPNAPVELIVRLPEK